MLSGLLHLLFPLVLTPRLLPLFYFHSLPPEFIIWVCASLFREAVSHSFCQFNLLTLLPHWVVFGRFVEFKSRL